MRKLFQLHADVDDEQAFLSDLFLLNKESQKAARDKRDSATYFACLKRGKLLCELLTKLEVDVPSTREVIGFPQGLRTMAEHVMELAECVERLSERLPIPDPPTASKTLAEQLVEALQQNTALK